MIISEILTCIRPITVGAILLLHHIAGFAVVSLAFDFPVCPPVATPDIDGDGCYISRGFGEINHVAEDWNGEGGGNSDLGDPVFAIAAGTIVSAQNEGPTWGNVIVIEHELIDGQRVRSLYGHLDVMFRTSGNVVRGEPIGTIGRGYCYGIDANGEPICDYLAHLHFEIRDDTSIGVVNPYRTDTSGWCNPSTFIEHEICVSGNEITHSETATDLPQNLPDPGQVVSTINFPVSGKIVAMELFFANTHQCERNLISTLRSPPPDNHLVFVQIRGLERCSGIPTMFDSTNTGVGEPEAFGGKEAGGLWTFTMTDDTADGNSGSLDVFRLTITVEQ